MKSLLFNLVVSLSFLWAADLALIEKEPNLEKRSQLALEHASKAVDDARRAYSDGQADTFRRGLEDARQLADLSYQSLKNTGKAARRSPKYWKRAEQRLRELARRVDNLEKDVSLEDREAVRSLENRLHELHDQVLNDIMTKK